MMRTSVMLIGGGGHCKACIDVIEAEGRLLIAGIVDMPERKGTMVSGYEIVAGDEEIPSLVQSCRNFLVTLGQVRSAEKRRSLFAALKKYDVQLPVVISPRAYVSKNALIGEGTVIMHGAVVNAGARIGRNCIINTAAVIEHDVIIEDHCHVSTGSIINGECHIGEGTFVGSRSVISNAIAVAKDTVIGAGTVVIHPLIESGTYAGVPARRIK